MTDHLKNELLLYYGELMQVHGNTFDIFEKGKIVDKMNAINLLLGLPSLNRQGLGDIIREIAQRIK